MAMAAPEGDGESPLSEINVTPLVDVMLVLLIIFMVAAPMLTTGLDVELPSAAAPRLPIDPEQTVLTVLPDQRVLLGDEEVDRASLEERLRGLQIEEVLVRADTTVPYGSVVAVLAAVRGAGISRMGLVTDPVDLSGP